MSITVFKHKSNVESEARPKKHEWAWRIKDRTGLTPPDVVTGIGVALRCVAANRLSHAAEMTRRRRMFWLGVSVVGNLCDNFDGRLARGLDMVHDAGAIADGVGDFTSMTWELVGYSRGGLLRSSDAAKLGALKVSNAAATALTVEGAGAGIKRETLPESKRFVALAAGALLCRAAAVSITASDGSPEAPAAMDIQDRDMTGAAKILDWIGGRLMTAAEGAGVQATQGYWSRAIQSRRPTDLAA